MTDLDGPPPHRPLFSFAMKRHASTTTVILRPPDELLLAIVRALRWLPDRARLSVTCSRLRSICEDTTPDELPTPCPPRREPWKDGLGDARALSRPITLCFDIPKQSSFCTTSPCALVLRGLNRWADEPGRYVPVHLRGDVRYAAHWAELLCARKAQEWLSNFLPGTRRWLYFGAHVEPTTAAVLHGIVRRANDRLDRMEEG